MPDWLTVDNDLHMQVYTTSYNNSEYPTALYDHKLLIILLIVSI